GFGDRFIITGDLLSSSTNKSGWHTLEAELRLIGGGNHRLSVTGADLGDNFDGYVDNFAWGTLALGAGDGLELLDGDGTPGGALYVHNLLLAGGIGQLSSIQSNGLNM